MVNLLLPVHVYMYVVQMCMYMLIKAFWCIGSKTIMIIDLREMPAPPYTQIVSVFELPIIASLDKWVWC